MDDWWTNKQCILTLVIKHWCQKTIILNSIFLIFESWGQWIIELLKRLRIDSNCCHHFFHSVDEGRSLKSFHLPQLCLLSLHQCIPKGIVRKPGGRSFSLFSFVVSRCFLHVDFDFNPSVKKYGVLSKFWSSCKLASSLDEQRGADEYYRVTIA